MDRGAARAQGCAHLRRPRRPGVRRRPSLPVQAAGDRLGHHRTRSPRAAARRETVRGRARRPPGRRRGADEHGHPDVLQALALALAGRRQGQGEGAPDRRRRRSLELPGLDLRQRRRAAVAHLRPDAGRAGPARHARRQPAHRRRHRPRHLRQRPREHDDGGARPHVPAERHLRAHDPDPDARRAHDRVRSSPRKPMPCSSPGRPDGDGLPRALELREVQSHLPLPASARPAARRSASCRTRNAPPEAGAVSGSSAARWRCRRRRWRRCGRPHAVGPAAAGGPSGCRGAACERGSGR